MNTSDIQLSAQMSTFEDVRQSRFNLIYSEMRDEYMQDHDMPWIIGYSGGKDSTMVVHLAFEMLLGLAPSQRDRPIHIIANDTLVENPLVVQHIIESIEYISVAARALGLPVETKITRPDTNQSFWVNVIGRGYPTPNRTFRWCTDRMKIKPTSRYIKSQVEKSGRVILLLGVRSSESSARSATIKRYDKGGRLNQHNDLKKCLVFRPIVDLTTDEVWEFLASNSRPWGGSHQKLIKLYRDAGGGECPVIMQQSDTPSCGTSSSRFGCWTCTVVDKDRSLEGFVDSGFSEFGPLLDFRDWLISIRNDKHRRQARRRNGQITITNTGIFIPGPFTLQTRIEILDRLQLLQEQTGETLISSEEIELIYKIWAEDIISAPKKQSIDVREIKKEK